jgi:hypothetical protein
MDPSVQIATTIFRSKLIEFLRRQPLTLEDLRDLQRELGNFLLEDFQDAIHFVEDLSETINR